MWKNFALVRYNRPNGNCCYQVSENGQIRNPSTGKILRTRMKQGYKYFQNKPLHKILAEAFIPNPNGYTEIDHINRNPLDNRLSNLRWCSRTINIRNSAVIKLCDGERQWIRSSTIKAKCLAKIFEISKSYVHKIRGSSPCV